MPVDAHNVTTDVERMDDDANPPRLALSTPAPRLARRRVRATRARTDARRPATPADATNDWYRRLGASHRRRDESVRLSARVIQERDNAQQMACRHRWPAIVEAMRTLIDCYNEGAGGETLILVDGPSGQGGPTATVTARSGRSLVMAVEGTDLCVRAGQSENSSTPDERWIGLHRTDEATAGYALQNWLTQLDACDSAIPVAPASRSTLDQG
jgi:hypothetical protein